MTIPNGRHTIKSVKDSGIIIVLDNNCRLEALTLKDTHKARNLRSGDTVNVKPCTGYEVTVEHETGDGLSEKFTAMIMPG